MESLAHLATRRPVAMTVLAAVVVLLGWMSWGQLPLDLLPDLQNPTLVVSVRSGDRPPAEMEVVYGEQVERRLFGVRGIREILQIARTGRLLATVTFDWDADMDLALVEVQKAVGDLGAQSEVDEVLVRRFDPRQSPVVVMGLVAPRGFPDLVELRRLARRQVAPVLEQLPGVAEVRVLGGRETEVRVEVDPARLEAHGLTLTQVEARLRSANADIEAGTFEESGRVALVRVLSRFRDLRDVSEVVLSYAPDGASGVVPVRVGDVARVVEAEREIHHLVRLGGRDGVREGVSLSIYKEAGANTVAVAHRVRRALEGLSADLPGVETHRVLDEAVFVERAISGVEQAALAGIVLAVLVLALFLRAAGPTAIIATAVPVSLLATLVGMRFAGLSLNLMTLGGLALGAGMLVDNAIVVVESIFRHQSGGESRAEAIPRGTGEVLGPIAASTLTSCVVFLPVLFVHGAAARLVEGMAFAVVASLLASLAVAVLLIPALATWLLPAGSRREAVPAAGRGLEALVGRLLRHPGKVLAAALLAVAAAVAGLAGLGTELMPPVDPGQLSLRLAGPPGWTVEATSSAVGSVEEILQLAAGDDLETILAEVGRLPQDDRLLATELEEENTARLFLRLGPGEETAARVRAAALPALDGLGGLETAWSVGSSALDAALGTTGPPLTVEIAGPVLDDLQRTAETLAEGLAGRAELWNVRSSLQGGPPELHLVLDRVLADGLGVELEEVARVLEAALDGRRATVLTQGDEERAVVLRLPAASLDGLERLPVTTRGGVRLTLGSLGRFVPHEGAREILRRNQRRVAQVTARVEPGTRYPQALAAVLEELDRVSPPPGVTLRLTGQEEERLRILGELRWAAVLALVLVLMVLAGTFESLLHPLTVLLAVPLALPGVAVVLLPAGRPLGVMALLGLILLSGIAVNNSILLVQTARRLMALGMDRIPALGRAAALRLRPIAMTTATTVLALLPLALGLGEAARLRTPLALTIIGGLLTSTLGALLVVPCLYLLLDRLRPSRPPGGAA